MKLHEYQAKQILSDAGVAVPLGSVASSPEQAAVIADRLGGRVVVKAQIHAGGRGRAGGIKLVSSSAGASQASNDLIGMNLVTPQTGSDGVPVCKVLVEEAIDIDRELYLGIVVDGGAEAVVVMASQAGGMDIEEVAEQTPEKLIRIKVEPVLGIQPYQTRRIMDALGIPPDHMRSVSSLITILYDVFVGNDCSLVEINPLVLTTDGRILAADAKITLDDDALFRQPNMQNLQDPTQESQLESKAHELGISYVKLDGNVGCLVNGAGLAMATMDVIGASGSAPANFLDVGGQADESKVAQALKIILSDPNVTVVLINVFGGILRCDTVARGILQVTEDFQILKCKLVVRMQGTNALEGRTLLSNSELDVTLVDDLSDAADAVRTQEQV